MTASTSTPTRGSARACSSTAASAGAASASISATSRTTSPSRRSAWAALASTRPHTDAYCDVHPPFQPNVKGQLTYPFPWGIGGSISFQSLPGAQVVANYPLTNTTPGPDARPRRSRASRRRSAWCSRARCIWIASTRRTSGSRRPFSYRATTIRPTVSVYNLFNANPTNTNAAFQTTYGASWLAPTVIMTPRFVDFGAAD